MKAVSPFIPSNKEENIDVKNINEKWKDDEQVMKQHGLLLKQPNIQMLFKDYYFDITNANSGVVLSNVISTTVPHSTGDDKTEKVDKASPKLTELVSVKSSAHNSVMSNMSNR